jgi:hypothetical protein
MHPFIILSQGVLLLLLLIAASVRPGAQSRSAILRRRFASRAPGLALAPVPLSSDSTSLAGVPLRILLSDRASPGALLRDTLLTRPSRDD